MRIQREGAQLQIRGTWSAGPGDDQARFLADLRALRDSAAIGYDELAARAHYPSDVLKEAENGPPFPACPSSALTSAPARGTCWTGKNGGGGSTPTCRTTRIFRSGPPGRAPPRWPVPVRASASRPPTSTIRSGSRPRSGVAIARSGQASRRSGDPGISAPAASGTGLESPDPGLPADAGCERGQLGSQHGLGSGSRPGRHGGEREPRGRSRHARAVRRRVHQHPRCRRPRSGPRSSPGCRRASLKPGRPAVT